MLGARRTRFPTRRVDVMRAEITGIAPFFIVRDVPTSMAFYRDKLGFEITFEGPEPNDIFVGIVERGGAFTLMKAVGVEPVPSHTHDVKQGIARWDASPLFSAWPNRVSPHSPAIPSPLR